MLIGVVNYFYLSPNRLRFWLCLGNRCLARRQFLLLRQAANFVFFLWQCKGTKKSKHFQIISQKKHAKKHDRKKRVPQLTVSSVDSFIMSTLFLPNSNLLYIYYIYYIYSNYITLSFPPIQPIPPSPNKLSTVNWRHAFDKSGNLQRKLSRSTCHRMSWPFCVMWQSNTRGRFFFVWLIPLTAQRVKQEEPSPLSRKILSRSALPLRASKNFLLLRYL